MSTRMGGLPTAYEPFRILRQRCRNFYYAIVGVISLAIDRYKERR